MQQFKIVQFSFHLLFTHCTSTNQYFFAKKVLILYQDESTCPSNLVKIKTWLMGYKVKGPHYTSETAPIVNNTYYAPPTGRQSAQQHIAGSRSAYASSSSSTHSPHYSRNTSSRGRFITNTTPRFDYNLLVRILVVVWCVQLLVG